MSTTEEPAGRRETPAPQFGGDYRLHPLSALDGVLIHLTLNGETVGFAFGPTEEQAAAVAAQQLLGSVATAAPGVQA
jgi:hypothetical protein